MKQLMLEFYDLYDIDYWRAKLCMLSATLLHYNDFKQSLNLSCDENEDRSFLNMLKIEIHFTYFQIVESLFEMIFALEGQSDTELWFNLTNSNWRDNFRNKIPQLAEHGISFLDREITVNGNVRPFLEYVFYYDLTLQIDENEQKKNLDVISQAIHIFACEFIDREEYNAYKHSLRLFHSTHQIAISGAEKDEWISLTDKKDALVFLEKSDENKFKKIIKGFDPSRDINMIDFVIRLISNIMTSRRIRLLGKDGELFGFHKTNFDDISFARQDTSKWTSTYIVEVQK